MSLAALGFIRSRGTSKHYEHHESDIRVIAVHIELFSRRPTKRCSRVLRTLGRHYPPLSAIVDIAPMNDTHTELVAVVEVPEKDRVRCQHAGCGRPISKRVHILRLGTELTFVGSTCFRKHFTNQQVTDRTSATGGSAGTRLTTEELQLLESNTQQLLTQLRERYRRPTVTAPSSKPVRKSRRRTKNEPIDHDLWQRALAETKSTFRNERGLDPEMPGWSGWVKLEARKLYEKFRRGEET